MDSRRYSWSVGGALELSAFQNVQYHNAAHPKDKQILT